MTLPDSTTVDDLCERAARRAMIDQHYPEDDVGSAFNEVSPTQLESLLNTISDMQKTQSSMQRKHEEEIAALKESVQTQQPPHHLSNNIKTGDEATTNPVSRIHTDDRTTRWDAASNIQDTEANNLEEASMVTINASGVASAAKGDIQPSSATIENNHRGISNSHLTANQ